MRLTNQEKRDLRDLDSKIQTLAKKVWAEHPNNPTNRKAKS